MLHKNKGVNKIKNEDGMETRIRGRQNNNNKNPEVEEGEPRPMKQSIPGIQKATNPLGHVRRLQTGFFKKTKLTGYSLYLDV